MPRRCWLSDETHSSVHRKNSWRAHWPCIISNHRSKLAPFFRSPRRKARRFCCRPRPARAGLGSGGEDTCDSVTSDLREAVTAWMCSFSKAKLQGSPGTANTSNNVCPIEDVWRCVNVSAHSLSMPLLTLWGQVVTMSLLRFTRSLSFGLLTVSHGTSPSNCDMGHAVDHASLGRIPWWLLVSPRIFSDSFGPPRLVKLWPWVVDDLEKPRPGFLLEIIFFFHVQFVGGVFGHHLTPSILPLGPSTSAISTFSWTSSASSTGSSSNISPYSAQVMYGQERPYRDQRRQQNRLTISRIQDSEMTITDLNRLDIWLDGLIEYHRIKSCNALCSCWDSQVSSCTVPEADCHNHYSISCQMLVDSHTTLWMLWSLPIFAPNWNMIGWGWERAPSKWMKNLKLARQKNQEAYSFYLGLQCKLLKPQTFRRTGGPLHTTRLKIVTYDSPRFAKSKPITQTGTSDLHHASAIAITVSLLK